MTADSGRAAGHAAEPAEAGAGVPRRVLVAGDWHANEGWALSVIRRARSLLADQPRRVILHLGDFGIWPDPAGRAYLAHVAAALAAADAEMWFIDGNHEDFPLLDRLVTETTPDGRRMVRPGLFHLPRGCRWAWHGRTWLACGGGVSLDRAERTEGVDWWPEEEITDEQEVAITAAGHADVLVSHDCPAAVAHAFARPPAWWAPADLARNDAHRRRLQRILAGVKAGHVMHGHLHRAYQRCCDFGYGTVQVTGLAADGRRGNYAVLDVAAMRWDLPGGWFRGLARRPAAG